MSQDHLNTATWCTTGTHGHGKTPEPVPRFISLFGAVWEQGVITQLTCKDDDDSGDDDGDTDDISSECFLKQPNK